MPRTTTPMQTQFPHAYVLNVMADDQPGIVAAVTQAIGRLGGNIDVCSQTVVEGYFTLIMIVSFAKPVEPETLAAEVRGEPSRHYQVSIRPFAPRATGSVAGKVERFVLTTFGKDKPGIVRRFSQYLAGRDINIIDLFAHREAEQFLLIAQLEIPTVHDLALLHADLDEIAKEEGFTIKLQHEGIFVATNQLRLDH
jgi:glycine cleavage system transcriptional repressor